MRIDEKTLFPLIVPAGYLSPESPTPVRIALLDGIDVALGIDHPGQPGADGIAAGLFEYARDVDLAAARLTPIDAYRIALDNLATAAEQGIIRASGVGGEDGTIHMVIWADHWLAATCLLLPGLHKLASSALGTGDVIATIPHRDVLILFGDHGAEHRARIIEMVRENERDGRKPITDRLLRLLPDTTRPFTEQPVVDYFE